MNQDWNGMDFSYVVDFHDEQPQDYWIGKHDVKISEPGLHAPCGGEMKEAATLVNVSQELPPWVASDGLREPKCPNPYLGLGDAP